MTRWLPACAWISLSTLVYGQNSAPNDLRDILGTPPAFTASAYVGADHVLLGRPFTLIVIATAEHTPQHKNFQPAVPTSLDLGPAFDVGRRFTERRARVDGTPTVEIQIELTPWHVGDQSIPPIPVDIPVRGTVERIHTQPTPITVAGLVGDDRATIRDIAKPMTITRQDWSRIYWVVLGLGVSLALLCSWWIFQRRRRYRRASIVQKIEAYPPDVEALERLRALAASRALDDDDPTPAFEHMFEIMRSYLGRCLQISIDDATSEQLLAAARGDARSLSTTTDLIQPWLTDCDLVKFANARPSAEDARAAHRDAIDIVEQTRAAYLTDDGDAG